MTPNEKIRYIMDKFGLDLEHMREITHSTKNRMAKLLNDEAEPTETELNHICETFSIKPSIMRNGYNLPMLKMKIKIDMTKYKNLIEAYVAMLNEYYDEPWEVYVLARIPYKNAFDTFLDTIFPPKPEKMEDGVSFTPNYLAIKGENMLIINIYDEIFEVTEVDERAKEKRFVFGRYKYVRANKIHLKKYVPEVEFYFKNF